ncbi:hypothetical protein [Cardinium endosymbiont of Culicoides punctatus]|uniref:hypothetical protein n=1 Tax=Cardinium endosymbiont of Culicoides punctatus TaxID=2304601 RepID=UPI001058680E|nr:hypothetical protein [Cardinium endosymbiont of Culicoides punctatus]TDG95272.1 hypothetical protein CCPUN_05670 [Cardinium endosymbiont of Culicoides punctatus]
MKRAIIALRDSYPTSEQINSISLTGKLLSGIDKAVEAIINAQQKFSIGLLPGEILPPISGKDLADKARQDDVIKPAILLEAAIIESVFVELDKIQNPINNKKDFEMSFVLDL